MSATPTIAFLFRHPAHFVALGFGAGLSPWAPGTLGTLLAIPMALALRRYAGDIEYGTVVVVLFGIGVWASHVTGRGLDQPDHGGIVIDEVVAFLLVLFFTGVTPERIAIAFALFRFFDIVKPPPIRQLDARMKNGMGVMLDDLLAAGFTLLVFAVGQRILG
jgi:phosphatidylglycerophosphatase A